MIRLGTLTTETIEFLERCVQARLNILISGGTGTGKTTLLNVLSEAIPDDDRIVTIEDSAELSAPPAAHAAARVAPAEHRGRGRGHDPRPRPQQPAHAPRPDHRRRGPRRRGARHAPGDEHGPRRLALDGARELAARRALAPRDDGDDGRLRDPAARDPPADLVGARPDRADRAPRGRQPPRHRDHRGAADGVRGDHAPGAVHVQDRADDGRAGRRRQPAGRPGSGRRS